jgi:hypothetical protein
MDLAITAILASEITSVVSSKQMEKYSHFSKSDLNLISDIFGQMFYSLLDGISTTQQFLQPFNNLGFITEVFK